MKQFFTPGFEISMQYFSVMHVLNRQQQLNGPLHNLSLWDSLALLLIIMNNLVQVTSLENGMIVWEHVYLKTGQNSVHSYPEFDGFC